jgi:hypothetical protein
MRIVVFALSIAAFLTLGFEWLDVGIGGIGEIISSGHGFENVASAGAAVALLYLIGGPFAMGRPLVSFVVLALGSPRWHRRRHVDRLRQSASMGAVALSALSLFGQERRLKFLNTTRPD